MKNFSLRPQQFNETTLKLFEQGFYIFETMLTEKGEIPLASYHYQRLEKSLTELQWPKLIQGLELNKWWNQLLEEIKTLGINKQKIKLSLIPNKDEQQLYFNISASPYSPPTHKLKLLFHPQAKRHSKDSYWKYKQGQRSVLNDILHQLPEGSDDVIFINEKDEICETSRHNLYIEREGIIYTPPLSCALLPGVYRSKLLQEGKAQEKIITKDEFQSAQKILISNALIGLKEASL